MWVPWFPVRFLETQIGACASVAQIATIVSGGDQAYQRARFVA
jgi:hypothetical protein